MAKTSLLDSVTGCVLLHRGGEASIYLLNVGGNPYVLKWYGEGFSFDEHVIEIANKVRSPGLYRIEEWGSRNGTPYLVYDYIKGVPSDKLGRLPVAVALFAGRQVVAALMELRKQGASHGDLSPANVVFSAEKNLQAIVIDCGIVGPGALAYASPERFQGKVPDEKSDLFSLGLLLYRWIAGEDLVQAGSFEQFAEQMANVQQLNVSEKLYTTGLFNTADGALQLSALEPLWAGLICSDAEDRVDDLDELDELLEIALDKIGGGEVSLATSVSRFASERLNGAESLLNAVQKVPESMETVLPFAVQNKNNRLKWGVLGVLVLILLLIVLLLSGGTMSFGIDATGDLLLKRSRNIDTSVEPEKAPNIKVDSLLLELPVPSMR